MYISPSSTTKDAIGPHDNTSHSVLHVLTTPSGQQVSKGDHTFVGNTRLVRQMRSLTERTQGRPLMTMGGTGNPCDISPATRQE